VWIYIIADFFFNAKPLQVTKLAVVIVLHWGDQLGLKNTAIKKAGGKMLELDLYNVKISFPI
jgi:hypothetical protein